MEPILRVKFPVSAEVTPVRVLDIAGDWLAGNRHLQVGFRKQKLDEIVMAVKDTSQPAFCFLENEFLIERILTSGQDKHYLAFSFGHPLPEEGDLIVTRLGFAKDSDRKSNLAVSLEKSSVARVSHNIGVRKPILVNQLIERLPKHFDGEIPISKQPLDLIEEDAEIIATSLKGKAGNVLPIVYVSRSRRSNLPLTDPVQLASRLAGMAHVFVEPDYTFNLRIEEIIGTKDYSCFNGAVRVYWPGIKSPKYNWVWIPDFFENSANFKRDPVQEILTYIADRTKGMYLGTCDVRSIIFIQSRNNLETKRAALEGRVREVEASGAKKDETMRLYDEVIAEGDKAQAELTARVEQLTRQVGDLTTENAFLQENVAQIDSYKKEKQVDNQLASNPDVLLSLDRLLEVSPSLSPSIKNRIQAVLTKYNEQLEDAKQKREQEQTDIRAAFLSYRTMNSHCTQTLREWGFEYTDEGKHYKVFRKGSNPDVCVTVSKTCSDGRAGQRIVNDFERVFWNL
jgi:hypothetical protein